MINKTELIKFGILLALFLLFLLGFKKIVAFFAIFILIFFLKDILLDLLVKYKKPVLKKTFTKQYYEKWLLDAVNFFRRIGFFKQYKKLNNESLIKKIEEFQLKEDGYKLDEPNDFYLLSADTKRVWLNDIEADVMKGNNIYVRTLKEWGSISRGQFKPKNIKETWESEEGPIFITFELNGKLHKIQPKYINDYIDHTILSQINKIMKGEHHFEACESADLGQVVFITMLSEEEKKTIEKERGWKFSNLES